MKRFRLVLLALLLGLLASELGLRVFARLTHRERGLCFDPELGWRMVPGLVKGGPFWGGREPARINSHGWRDVETSWQKPAGTKRMVVVGDSFTYGVGVDAGERFSAVLETLVPGLDVVNLGMNAVGPDQELLYLEKDGLRYEPDLVLCAVFEGNDFGDVGLEVNGYWPKPWFELEDGVLAFVPPAHSWDVRLREAGYVGEAFYRLLQGRMPYQAEAPAWRGRDTTPLVEALLLRMGAASERAGARFLVLFIRVREEDPRSEAVRATLASRGVPVIEAEAHCVDPVRRAELLLPDGHWTAAGHREVAECIAAELGARGWP